RALDALRNATAYELREALERLKATQTTLAILERDLLPQSKEAFEAARAGYASGKTDSLGLVDAERSYLQVRVDQVRARARLGAALADIERAMGGPVQPSEGK